MAIFIDILEFVCVFKRCFRLPWLYWFQVACLVFPAMLKPGRALEVAADGSRVTWTAKTKYDWLLAIFYDEFALQSKLPAVGGGGPNH